MKSAIVAAAFLSGAQAFVTPSAFNGVALTAAPKASSSALKMGFESEIGAQPPIGFWDPLGLLADADQERFDRLRYVEIKHGRIAMLAVLGHIVQQNYRLPGMLSIKDNISFEDVPNGLAAFSKIPPLGTLQIILAIGVHELFVVKQVEGSFPGDCTTGGNIFQSAWDSFSEEKKASKRAIELNNGRAAQMGILAMMVHEQLSNQPYIINDLAGLAYKFN